MDSIQSVGLKPLQNFDNLKIDKAISGYIKYDNDAFRRRFSHSTEVSPNVGRVRGLESDSSGLPGDACESGSPVSEAGSGTSQSTETQLTPTIYPNTTRNIEIDIKKKGWKAAWEGRNPASTQSSSTVALDNAATLKGTGEIPAGAQSQASSNSQNSTPETPPQPPKQVVKLTGIIDQTVDTFGVKLTDWDDTKPKILFKICRYDVSKTRNNKKKQAIVNHWLHLKKKPLVAGERFGHAF